MMKFIYTLLIGISFAGCSKDSDKTCWDCEILCNGNNQPYNKVVCNDGEFPGPFVDANNNSCSYQCTKR